ncbi:TRAP transporter substrate-binding protein [Bisbaumannia pacifica]|uniref:TRAP transporter substrate-binding protein DctP n=1 Tax=Bisbaumannia pacifica TaxID=77098 RepID=A0ABD4L4A7_9GAMM|nr:TRAP transporter substrate-binding protein DctP [Halomonas pacifica]MBH8580917.1 TRAP transporter substrate-binding protein DctP [Halomonas pacifica]
MRTNRLTMITLTTAMLAGASSAAQAQQTHEWTLVSPLTPAISYMALYQELADNISERSDGRLKINFLSYGQHPFSGAEILSAVRDGIVQMGNTADVYVSSMEPAIAFLGLPFLFDNLDQAKTVYAELEEPYYRQIFADQYNAELTTGFVISGSAIHSNRPLNSLEAMRGQKIRVFGHESGEMIRLLGGEPSTVAFGELYTSLQRGTIDGALTGMDGANAARVYEVVDHNTWWNWSYPVEFTFVNQDAMAALPEDLQEIVREEARLINERIQADRDIGTMRILVDSIEQHGITVSGLDAETLEEFRARTQPIRDDWLQETGELGQQAFSIYQESLQ